VQQTAAHIPAIPIRQQSAAQLSQPIADQLPGFHIVDRVKALVSYWKSADLFQLTDQELNRESTLFTHDSVQRGLLKSCIFIAIQRLERKSNCSNMWGGSATCQTDFWTNDLDDFLEWFSFKPFADPGQGNPVGVIELQATLDVVPANPT